MSATAAAEAKHMDRLKRFDQNSNVIVFRSERTKQTGQTFAETTETQIQVTHQQRFRLSDKRTRT